MEKVFTESPFLDSLFQILVGGGYQTDINRNFLRGTDRTNLSLLQGTKKLYLYLVTEITYFIQKIVPPLAATNAPVLSVSAPVKEPFTWPKNSDAANSLGIEPQSTAINGLSFRLLS